MAGIGFELKKLFHRRGLMAMLRAYGYAGVICAGPMLLGVLLQFGVLIVSSWWQVGRPDRDLLVCMITYTLLASLVLTSFLSMPVTRFLAHFASAKINLLQFMLTATSTDFGKLKSSKSKIACQNILAGDLSYLFNYK